MDTEHRITKPCRFCEGMDLRITVNQGGSRPYEVVKCHDCGASAPLTVWESAPNPFGRQTFTPGEFVQVLHMEYPQDHGGAIAQATEVWVNAIYVGREGQIHTVSYVHGRELLRPDQRIRKAKLDKAGQKE